MRKTDESSRQSLTLGLLRIVVCLVIITASLPATLQATCFVQVSTYSAGISEFTITATRDLGSCKAPLLGYLFFQPTPSTNPIDGTVYVAGQSYAGATVVGYSPAGVLTVENGPYTVITPGTSYSPLDYSVFGYGTNYVYTNFKSGYFSLTTQPGGGTLKNWSYKMTQASLSAPALTPGGDVAGSGNDGILHSMDASNGARRYAPGNGTGTLGYLGSGAAVQSTFPVIPSNYLEPLAVSVYGSNCQTGNCDVAFMGAQDGTVWAFNVRTGVKLWQSPLLTNSGGAIVGSPVIQLRTFSNSTFRNTHTSYDLVIVGTHNNGDRTGNKIYFLRSDTGQVVWSTTPGNLDQVNGTAIVDYSNNTVWLASLSNSSTQPSLWKLSTTSGAVLSAITLPTSNKDVGGSPILNFNSAAPYLYLVTNGGDIVAVNTTNNAVTVGSNYGSGLVKNPFVLRNAARTGDEIYFSNSGGVYKALFSYAGGFSSDPNLVWSSNVVPSPSTPVPDHYPTPTALYVGGNDGKLYKLNASDGTQADVRTVNAGGSLIGDASVDIQLSKIYVGDSSGRIYSYDIF